jgi:hypothetical protein
MAGVMFVIFGVFFATFSTIRAGTAADMGPGYFPRVLSIILVLIGMILSLGSLSGRSISEKVGQFSWQTMVLIIGPVLLFGLILKPIGMILSLFVLIVASSFASHEFKWVATLINAVVLILMCVVIFVWSLKLQFQVWPFS